MQANVSQIGRDTLNLNFAGGSTALRFWAYNGTVGSSDGDDPLNQIVVPWNGRVRYAYLWTTNDPGSTIIGVHINLNLTPLYSNVVVPVGEGPTQIDLEGAFAAGNLLGFSVDPTSDPGPSVLCVAVEYDSSVL